jgi:flavin reductase (DIM6/NTAB) family NADH-FMN oxidoreductase RutF
MEKVRRLNLINSISGYKPANLIGTIHPGGGTNLAIFSSVFHLGSDPALLGFIMRPNTVVRNTYDNIRSSGKYTINHVHASFAEKAHYTAAKFDASVSEFEACHLTEEYIGGFEAPFVAESHLKIGLQLVEEIAIPANGTILIIGEVKHIFLPENAVREDGQLDYDRLNTVCITGLNRYHLVEEFADYPYARVDEVPDFKAEGGKKKKKPDSIVFDEATGKYDAALKPYATSVGGPAFMAEDVALWKNASTSKVSHLFRTRFEEIRNQYESMVDEIRWNEVVYNADFNFEPVIGEKYHLYTGKNGRNFLSLIAPNQWKREHLGSFKFSSERMWVKLEEESTA